MRVLDRSSWVLLAAFTVACGSASTPVDPPTGNVVPPGVPPSTSCDGASAKDIVVSGDDLDGFPPYAVAGCTLVYVSAAGDLVVRDLGTGAETTIALAADKPRRPAASPDLIAWEVEEGGHSVVRLRLRETGAIRTVPGAFASSGEPRTSGTSLVFTAWKGSAATDDTDIWFFDAKTNEARAVFGGAGQQRFADVNARYIVASDFSEDPDGRLDGNESDLADLVVFDRVTGAVTSRPLAGKQSFPILGEGDLLAYLDWGSIHPEPKLQAYELRTGRVVGDPTEDRAIAKVDYVSSSHARPALAGGTLEWIANPAGTTRLYRAPVDGSAAPLVVTGLDDLHLYAPAAVAGFTVLAVAAQTGGSDSLPRLRSVPR